MLTHLVLGCLVVLCLAVLAVPPGLASGMAECLPEFAALRGPLLGLSMALVALVVLVLAVVSVLVQRVARGTILTRASTRVVDVMIGALALGAAVIVISIVVVSGAQAGTPLLGLAQLGSALALAGLALVVLVLRSLLRRATTLQEAVEGGLVTRPPKIA